MLSNHGSENNMTLPEKSRPARRTFHRRPRFNHTILTTTTETETTTPRQARRGIGQTPTPLDLSLPNTAIMISEGGHDALIGLARWRTVRPLCRGRMGNPGNRTTRALARYRLAPKMALFAGGLADRYQRRDLTNSGYASDSYLTNTVIGDETR